MPPTLCAVLRLALNQGSTLGANISREKVRALDEAGPSFKLDCCGVGALLISCESMLQAGMDEDRDMLVLDSCTIEK